MLKLLGAVFIIAASTMGGIYIARSYSDRPKQLRVLKQALQMLETEIVYGAIPLHIAMAHIGKRITGPVKLIFLKMSQLLQDQDGASAYECWDMALKSEAHKTALKRQDKEIMLQFGQTLGVSDREDQMKHIRLTIQNLSQEESTARDEQKVYEKLSRNLGVLLGILIVILMY